MGTLETTPAPEPPNTPPAWPEMEWCDGGWSCQHRECLEELQAALDDFAEEAWASDQRARWGR